jgi:hypothetical protein
MKNSARQPVSAKGSKPAAKDITVSISQKKAAGAAAGATLGAIAAGPVGALVGGVVGAIAADNTETVKKELRSASKAVLKKAPTLHQVETAVVKAGKKTAVALKDTGSKVKAALVTPKVKTAAKTLKKGLVSSVKVEPKKTPAAKPAKKPAVVAKAPAPVAKKPAARKK